MNQEELVTLLKHNDLAVSQQRLSILAYLMAHREHPTCEMIYRGLKQAGHPTLSRATVYNNIRAFVDSGLVRELEIGDHERRYDIDTSEHSHFFCRSCGKIINLALSDELTHALRRSLSERMPGTVLERQDIHFTGLCPNCGQDGTKSNTTNTSETENKNQ